MSIAWGENLLSDNLATITNLNLFLQDWVCMFNSLCHLFAQPCGAYVVTKSCFYLKETKLSNHTSIVSVSLTD